MFCNKIKSKLRSLLSRFDHFVDAHIDMALKITGTLKQLLASPVADVVTALIPGELDEAIRERLISALDKAIAVLNIAEQCKAHTDLNDRLQCFVREVQSRDPHLQDALLLKLASLLSGQLDGARLKQSLYDLYTQAKYSAGK